MEVENQNQNQNQDESSSSTPDVLPPEAHHHSQPLHHMVSHHGTVAPNRIFVGGFDYKVNEGDLRHVFSQHGAVKEVKIVVDHLGMSKRYGFVTFETQDDVLKILRNVNGVSLRDRKLIIGQAVRKRQPSGQNKFLSVRDAAIPLHMSHGTYLTTPAGCPYTYHNGVAYFQCPNMSPAAHHWPPPPPVMLPQTIYEQPAYHHHQCGPNQYQWNTIQSPLPSGPVVFPQQSEYLYQPADGAHVQPPVPVMEDPIPEFADPTVLQVYPLYPQRTEGLTPYVLQHVPGKCHLNQKYRHYVHHKDLHFRPEATEPADASVLHHQPPLM